MHTHIVGVRVRETIKIQIHDISFFFFFLMIYSWHKLYIIYNKYNTDLPFSSC